MGRLEEEVGDSFAAPCAKVGKGELARDLEGVGLREGDTVLVHSSLSSIGYVPGGAEAVIDALMELSVTVALWWSRL
jgi:aminoglycoside 3-N-acetyltransferase